MEYNGITIFGLIWDNHWDANVGYTLWKSNVAGKSPNEMVNFPAKHV
jgi:hypothetical protein